MTVMPTNTTDFSKAFNGSLPPSDAANMESMSDLLHYLGAFLLVTLFRTKSVVRHIHSCEIFFSTCLGETLASVRQSLPIT